MIYHDPETGLLFSSFKYTGDDFERDMALMRENPRVREWWSMTDSYQEASLRGGSAFQLSCKSAMELRGRELTWLLLLAVDPAPTELGSGSAEQRSWRSVVVETARRGLLSSMIRDRWWVAREVALGFL